MLLDSHMSSTDQCDASDHAIGFNQRYQLRRTPPSPLEKRVVCSLFAHLAPWSEAVFFDEAFFEKAPSSLEDSVTGSGQLSMSLRGVAITGHDFVQKSSSSETDAGE